MQACIEKPDGRREPTRILLAHSDREIAQEIKRTLVALFPNVTVVTNGRGAAEKIKLGYFYMLVTGWQLPEFHAAQLIHILRSGLVRDSARFRRSLPNRTQSRKCRRRLSRFRLALG